MAGPTNAIAKKAEKEIGKELAQLAVRNGGSRFAGHIARNSKEWKHTYQHIKEHFKAEPGKASHTVFEQRFRTKGAIEKLLERALLKPSRHPVLTLLTIDGVPGGRPAVVIERQFSKVIGRKGTTECRIVRMVVDYQGDPITAYPVDRFLDGAVPDV